MTALKLPYSQRETVPLYFYPFLSTISNKVQNKDLMKYNFALNQEKKSEKDVLLYIHIPYCKNICHFCGFYRDIAKEEDDVLLKYVESLKNEIIQYAKTLYIQNSTISAIYFGGGTPSLLKPGQIEDLLLCIHDNFKILKGTELSFEGEVRTLSSKDRLKVLREHNCTRVSFGVQTFDITARKYSGLIPTLEQIDKCINNIQEYNYDINLDLMYGLPAQSLDVWKNDLNHAITLGASNIDIYDTVLYPHTVLFRRRKKLKDYLPDQNTRLKMLANGINLLQKAGYIHTTIEDFSLFGKEYQMKKLVYGGGNGRSEIIALGASAVGLINGFSYRNLPPDEYLSWKQENQKFPVQLMYKMDQEDFYKRALVFFPKQLKLDKNDIALDYFDNFQATINRLKEKELIIETGNCIELTEKGLFWTDNIAMEFIINKQEAHKIWKIGY